MLLQLLIIGVVVAINNLVVALALGVMQQKRHRARILLVFGAFEFLVPLIGVWLGSTLAGALAEHTEWLGPVLLISLGLFTLFSARASGQDREKLAQSVTTWQGLVMLSAGLSLDNLLVGFSLGLGGTAPLLLAGTILIFSVSAAALGLQIGHRVQRHYEAIGAAVSGVLLIGLGAAMLAGWL
ncbi:MAG: manganese efflux pump [Wenzhouxiangella sp.]|jgi:putative Mn2+ efflux pump MntP|nr:manganese efflux pump [Wenzhouxiangella sp.]